MALFASFAMPGSRDVHAEDTRAARGERVILKRLARVGTGAAMDGETSAEQADWWRR